MTLALCLGCGGTKIGALTDCLCGTPPVPDQMLNILFSDHLMAPSTIRQFGGVIKAINKEVDEPSTRPWTFMQFVSTHPSKLITITLPDDQAERVPDILASLDLPEVEVLPGHRNAPKKEKEERDPNTTVRKWWQFWKGSP